MLGGERLHPCHCVTFDQLPLGVPPWPGTPYLYTNTWTLSEETEALSGERLSPGRRSFDDSPMSIRYKPLVQDKVVHEGRAWTYSALSLPKRSEAQGGGGPNESVQGDSKPQGQNGKLSEENEPTVIGRF